MQAQRLPADPRQLAVRPAIAARVADLCDDLAAARAMGVEADRVRAGLHVAECSARRLQPRFRSLLPGRPARPRAPLAVVPPAPSQAH